QQPCGSGPSNSVRLQPASGLRLQDGRSCMNDLTPSIVLHPLLPWGTLARQHQGAVRLRGLFWIEGIYDIVQGNRVEGDAQMLADVRRTLVLHEDVVHIRRVRL